MTGPRGPFAPPEGYAETLADVARTGRRADRDEIARSTDAGAKAAIDGVALPELADAYLRVAEQAWRELPRVGGTATEARAAAGTVLAAARRLLAAACDGYDDSRRQAALRDEQGRREFVDELLRGRGDPGRLAERAQRYGVLLAGRHVVMVARGAIDDSLARRVSDALAARFGEANVLVAVHRELLVCVTSSGLRGTAGELAHHLLTTLGAGGDWQIGVGRPHTGPAGVVASYQEARNTLELADRLGFATPVLQAADLLVFPVLLRDREAITDLVSTVLGPLTSARSGAEPLLETLEAFFDCQGNLTAAARRLRISTRAVSYRLDRVKALTGYAPTEPTQRFTLQAAVLGARLLDWPATPLSG